MAMTLDRKELLGLARLGAEAGLEALEREREAILRSFPGIQRGSATHSTANDHRVRRRRRAMSAAERKAVSARMKKYWAGRRKEKGN
jgi:hypothetical protein